MSCRHSDKCTKEELRSFKQKVMTWLYDNFPDWANKFKLKAFRCYGGDVRLYDGTSEDLPNSKSSFRRETPNYNDKGDIIGWEGTRGVHSNKIVTYISINRDEFQKIKKVWEDKTEYDWDFWNEYLFRNLTNLKEK